MLAAAAGGVLARPRLLGDGAPPLAAGYGRDPSLIKDYAPGELWPLTFNPLQHRTAAALCDTILPADERSPGAAELKVQDFIDEWISAPYPAQRRDRVLVLGGLDWIEAQARRRLLRSFHQLDETGRRAICDLICAPPPDRADAIGATDHFFGRFRDLALAGFYTTPEGAKDLQFMGNSPSAQFAGPSDEILARIGVL